MKNRKIITPLLTLTCGLFCIGATFAWYNSNKARTNEIEVNVENNLSLNYVSQNGVFQMLKASSDNQTFTNKDSVSKDPLIYDYLIKSDKETQIRVSNIICSNTTDLLFKALRVVVKYQGQYKKYSPLENPNYSEYLTHTATTSYQHIYFIVFLDGTSNYCTETYQTSNSCRIAIELETMN